MNWTYRPVLALVALLGLSMALPEYAVAQTGDNPEAMQFIRRVTPRHQPSARAVGVLEPRVNPLLDPQRHREAAMPRQTAVIGYPGFGFVQPFPPVYHPPIVRPPHRHRHAPRPSFPFKPY